MFREAGHTDIVEEGPPLQARMASLNVFFLQQRVTLPEVLNIFLKFHMRTIPSAKPRNFRETLLFGPKINGQAFCHITQVWRVPGSRDSHKNTVLVTAEFP